MVFSLPLCAGNGNEPLLNVLDKLVSDRLKYTEDKRDAIELLKQKKAGLHTQEELYELNNEIIHQYETFVCDSAELYIHENISIEDGQGKWILTDDMAHDDLKREVAPWLGKKDEIVMRFKGGHKVTMKISTDGNSLRIIKD